ncbi:MAG: hypothetical protein JWL64_772, partial [Frankiales bacterium]|nr:hypothetical protein [Frankiales bacterium]
LDQLAALARQAMSQLELRRTANALLDEVAARTAAEHARAESEQRWQALVEHSPVGIAVIGADERFVYANPQALALAGAQHPDELVGRPAAAFFPLDPRTATDVIRGLLHGSEPAPAQRGALRRLDGTLVRVEVSVVQIAHRGERALQLELRDMTAQDAAERALRVAHDELESRQAFTDAILDSVDVGIVACDADGRMTVFNHAAKAWAGSDLPDQYHQVPDGATLHLLDADGQPLDNAQIPLIRALQDGVVRNKEILICPPGLDPTRVLCSGRSLTAADGRTMGAVVAMTDITASRAQTTALQASELRFRTTFVNDPAGLAILTTSRRALQVNPALCRMVGATEEQLLALPDLLALGSGENRADFVELTRRALDHPGTTVSVERQLVLASGKELWILTTFAALVTPGEEPCLLVQIEDIAERKRAEQLLTHRVLHDDLTGLPNRVMLMDRLTRALARLVRRPQDGIVAVLFCDLDGFKAVNDQYGHAAGDYLLIEVARRLTAMMRPTDTVARLSGDEFVVLCDRLTSHQEGSRIAERLEQGLAEPVRWDGQEVRVTTSIGISYGDATVTAEQLVRDADTAMYRAKRFAKDRRGLRD